MHSRSRELATDAENKALRRCCPAGGRARQAAGGLRAPGQEKVILTELSAERIDAALGHLPAGV